MSLLEKNELKKLNTSIENVPEFDFLTLGVYPMKIEGLQRKTDKNGDPYILMTIDTGFSKINSDEKRLFYQTFHLRGSFPNGDPKIDMLAKFLKRCFGIKEISEDGLQSIVGKRLAVATKKDNEDYICYWYADSISDIQKVTETYFRKLKEKMDGDMAKKGIKELVHASEKGEDDLPF